MILTLKQILRTDSTGNVAGRAVGTGRMFFIRVISTVIKTITHPTLVDTLFVHALEFVFGTLGMNAVLGFIRSVSAIIISITIERREDALKVCTLELR